jgi:hypothetical protein
MLGHKKRSPRHGDREKSRLFCHLRRIIKGRSPPAVSGSAKNTSRPRARASPLRSSQRNLLTQQNPLESRPAVMVVTSFRALMRPNRQVERRQPLNSIEVARTKIRRRAERQAGVIARNQALRYGLPQHVLERDRRRGALKRVLPGVDVLAGTPETGEQRLWAAALWMEDAEGVFSHTTAAKLWRLPEIPSDNIDILLTRWRSSPAPWIRVHTTKILGSTERTLIGRHPVTTIDRTLFDLGTCVDEEALEIFARRRSAEISATPRRPREIA